jgi:hypothetical protein
MKLLLILFSVLSVSIYSQRLDINKFTDLQEDLFKLNNQLVDYGVAYSLQNYEIIANINGTYTSVLSYYKQILEVTFAQKFNAGNADEKNSTIDEQIRIEEWIKTFEDFKADISYRQKILYDPKLKKNTEDAIMVLDKSIKELKKNNC